ncbi:MAG TPA: thioredoxin [Gemmataceae bacterium]|jgi:thioredoxin 1|nr:thioredoxin [Gemmataceae bacterium]
MASANVVELTSANWESEVVNSDVPVMVDFWAPWCGPCRMLAPTVDRLAEQFSGRVKVGKLNTDDHQEVAVRYAISGIPQLLFFHGGDKPKERLVGVQAEATLVKTLNRLLGV